MSLPPALAQAIADALEEAIIQIRISFMLELVGYTVLIYDLLIMLPDEIQHIWKADKTIASVLLLVNRYTTLIILTIDMYDGQGEVTYISDHFCLSWYFVEATWYVASFGIIHILVSMRVVAMWGRARWVIVLLGALLLTYFSVTWSIVYSSLISRANTIKFDPVLRLCFLSITPYLWTCWIPPLILETILFVLSCVQTFKASRYSTRTRLLHVLIRDGAFHFFVILCCSLLNMTAWVAAPPTFVKGTLRFGMAISNVMISRMMINLRTCSQDPTLSGPPSARYRVEEVEMDECWVLKTDTRPL